MNLVSTGSGLMQDPRTSTILCFSIQTCGGSFGIDGEDLNFHMRHSHTALTVTSKFVLRRKCHHELEHNSKSNDGS